MELSEEFAKWSSSHVAITTIFAMTHAATLKLSAFKLCLNSACGSLRGNGFQWWIEFRQAACKLDGSTLYAIVNFAGSSAFKEAQMAHGCN
ncbi:unnamed protein product [Rotaria sp. Silwood2]|nr:unnamed protein product [Rotaria sp. Silwood2]